jgi:trimethylamine--corrinoid protein Co-methyltransferase
MARFYGVPCGGYIGLSNAKVNDAQSGFETGMSGVAALLSGNHLFNMAGLLDALMSFDFAKAVIDDEIVAMLRRIQRGLEISEENFALDVIKEVGPGGMFADHLHTLERMRSTGLLPEIADRDPRQGWIEKGGLDSQGRHAAHRDILTRDAPSLFRGHCVERFAGWSWRVRAAGGMDARRRRGAVRPSRAAPAAARPAGLSHRLKAVQDD